MIGVTMPNRFSVVCVPSGASKRRRCDDSPIVALRA
jgi:hypothetical protein